MTEFSEFRLIPLVFLVWPPNNRISLIINILNIIEHDLHLGHVPGTYQAIFISRTPMYINAHNCVQNYPQNARKNLQNIHKNPHVPANP